MKVIKFRFWLSPGVRLERYSNPNNKNVRTSIHSGSRSGQLRVISLEFSLWREFWFVVTPLPPTWPHFWLSSRKISPSIFKIDLAAKSKRSFKIEIWNRSVKVVNIWNRDLNQRLFNENPTPIVLKNKQSVVPQRFSCLPVRAYAIMSFAGLNCQKIVLFFVKP